jgi:sulfoxide reductase heme-binding subunit YedZ
VRQRTRGPASKSRGTVPLWIVATALATIPLAKIVFDLFTGGLGVDPIEELIRRTGWWALTLLVATLAVTPVRRFTGWNRIIQIRKPLGLMSFFYAVLHFLVYVGIDQFFAFDIILEDILERPYITAGFTALLMLTALAVTSRRDSIRKLGGKKWRRIHSLIYPAALLGVLHYYWLVKADTRPPLAYAAVVVVLLASRVRAGKEKAAGKAG